MIGGVKERPRLYASQFAQRGFIALNIDSSYNGEWWNLPPCRLPDVFVEDFSEGVDYLGTLPYVDRDKIGGVGICGSDGFLLAAAQVDTRFKAVANSVIYDISRATGSGWQDSLIAEQRAQARADVAAQRWADVDAGEPALTTVFPDTFEPDTPDPITAELHEFYVTDHGRHPRSIGGFTITSALSHLNFGELRWPADIAPRPVLLTTGENAHSRYFTVTVFEQATEPKDLIVVPGARHIDLDDRTDLIPFDTLESLFTDALEPAGHFARP